MKQFKFLAGATASILLLFTSCLGDTNSTRDYHNVPAMASSSSFTKTIIESSIGKIYSESLNGMYSDEDCMLVSFQYDSSDPNNVNEAENGYSYVKLLAMPTSVDKGYAEIAKTDTSALIDEKEIALTLGSYAGAGGYAGKYLFLYSVFKGMTDQKNRWYLFYDEQQTPRKESDVNIYTLFIRAVEADPGKTPAINNEKMNAFRVANIIDEINSKERGNTVFGLDIQYISEINEETSAPTWKSSDILQFYVDNSEK